ncbi:unnamed protein product [Pedinophyceae sp. YPF-701]|nr:unnamed protein product [Pedinophyceae sp. YPF-701]
MHCEASLVHRAPAAAAPRARGLRTAAVRPQAQRRDLRCRYKKPEKDAGEDVELAVNVEPDAGFSVIRSEQQLANLSSLSVSETEGVPSVQYTVLEVDTHLRAQLGQPIENPLLRNKVYTGTFIRNSLRDDTDLLEISSIHTPGVAKVLRRRGVNVPAGGKVNAYAHRAGPRAQVYWDPTKIKAGILTSDGLCPGTNVVIREIVRCLEDYGVDAAGGKILGIPFGFKGLAANSVATEGDLKLRPLQHRDMKMLSDQGGSYLGTSRTAKLDDNDIKRMVKNIDIWGLDHLYIIAGRSGCKVAEKLSKELKARDVQCAVITVPKTVDNCMPLLDRTFGFDSAVQAAQDALRAADVEASSGLDGIGIVKVMGKDSGFIASQASLSSGLVDLCLIPEVPANLHGPNGVFQHLRKILHDNGHAVICLSEGCGPNFTDSDFDPERRNSTGDKPDVGVWLRNQIKKEFPQSDVKYIDPTYMIRSQLPCPSDHGVCTVMGTNAVHGAFAGYTNLAVGLVNTHYAFLPISTITGTTRKVSTEGKLWSRLCASIQQPNFAISE